MIPRLQGDISGGVYSNSTASSLRSNMNSHAQSSIGSYSKIEVDQESKYYIDNDVHNIHKYFHDKNILDSSIPQLFTQVNIYIYIYILCVIQSILEWAGK